MSRFHASGRRRNAVTPRRTDPESEPGTLLGEKRIACFRCGEEFRAGRMRAISRGRNELVRSRIYVCAACDDAPGEPESEA